MPISRSYFFFFLDSCNLVKLPFEQSVEWYSRLHLLLLVMVVKRQVKRVGEVYLERSEMVNSVARQVQRRERSGSELETVSVHLSKVPLLYWSTGDDTVEWHLCSIWFPLDWVFLYCLSEVVGIWKPKLVLLYFRSEINRSQKQSLRASNFAFQLLSLCPLQKALGIVME